MHKLQSLISKKSVLKIVLAVCILVLISGATYGTWRFLNKSRISVDWKTCKNEKYSIKYPKTWQVDSSYSPELLAIFAGSESSLEYALITLTYKNDIPMESILEKYKKYNTLLDEGESRGVPHGVKTFIIEDAVIDTVKGYKITPILKDNVDETGIVCLFPDKDNQGFFEFEATSKGEKYKEYGPIIFNQVLSSFKFTK